MLGPMTRIQAKFRFAFIFDSYEELFRRFSRRTPKTRKNLLAMPEFSSAYEFSWKHGFLYFGPLVIVIAVVVLVRWIVAKIPRKIPSPPLRKGMQSHAADIEVFGDMISFSEAAHSVLGDVVGFWLTEGTWIVSLCNPKDIELFSAVGNRSPPFVEFTKLFMHDRNLQVRKRDCCITVVLQAHHEVPNCR